MVKNNMQLTVILYLLARFVAWTVTMHFLFYSFASMTTFTAVAVGFFMSGYVVLFVASVVESNRRK